MYFKGFLQKQEQTTGLIKKGNTAVHFQNMRDNLYLTGMDEEDNEEEGTATELVTDFFSQTMKIAKPIGLANCKRVGNSKPCSIFIKLKNGKDKATIFNHAKNLKDARNSNDQSYSLNNQLPRQCRKRSDVFNL